MAKIIFKGVPDFTEVRAEIAKLKQEVASVSSTKVNLNGTAQGLNGAANAAGKLAGNLFPPPLTQTGRPRGRCGISPHGWERPPAWWQR